MPCNPEDKPASVTPLHFSHECGKLTLLIEKALDENAADISWDAVQEEGLVMSAKESLKLGSEDSRLTISRNREFGGFGFPEWLSITVPAYDDLLDFDISIHPDNEIVVDLPSVNKEESNITCDPDTMFMFLSAAVIALQGTVDSLQSTG